jgi:biopolymer transport protein ExbB/TolQ
MNTLIHADIFFYVTTIVVIALGVCTLVLIFFLIKTFKHISEIAERIKKESAHIIDDVSELREKIKEEGTKMASVNKVMKGILVGKTIFDAFKKTKGKKSHGE